MSTIFWNALKLSPAILGASLLVASSTYARESIPDQTAATSAEQSATVKPATEPLAQQPQSIAVASSIPARESLPEQAAATVELHQAVAKETSASQLTPSGVSLSGNPAPTTLAQQVPAAENTTTDSSEVLQQINRYSTEESNTSLDQVTNVSQLRDVSPGDWAYEALRSLVERYGCIAGYPDGTFKGRQATTRYEFAAGLNACLNQVERLITSSTEGFVRRQDLETLQRLVNEFRTELTTLGARVDKLEGRVSFLEDHQFSTTTKLNGEVVFGISDSFGGENLREDNTVFQDRVRLNFDTSFTGKDRLRTRLQARNATRLSKPASVTNEGRFAYDGDEGNAVNIDFLGYRAPIGKQILFQLFANQAGLDDAVANNTLNPLDSTGSGALSRFGVRSPIYRLGAGNGGAGAALTIGRTTPIRVDLGYISRSNVFNTPTTTNPTPGAANNPGEDSGLFNGDYSAIGQVTFQPSKAFSIAATYVQTYDRRSLSTGTGSLASQIQTGTGPILRGVGRPVVGNSYGVEASFALSPQFIISGWGGYTKAIVLGTGSADVWNFGGTLALNDLGSKGSTLGFVVGMEPKLTGTSPGLAGRLAVPQGQSRSDRDTGLHVEGFYKYKLNNNISVTPGVIWLTAPGHDERNDGIVIGTLRTTFTF
jgi:hypothetical protein